MKSSGGLKVHLKKCNPPVCLQVPVSSTAVEDHMTHMDSVKTSVCVCVYGVHACMCVVCMRA